MNIVVKQNDTKNGEDKIFEMCEKVEAKQFLKTLF
jgi:hypothetical protein